MKLKTCENLSMEESMKKWGFYPPPVDISHMRYVPDEMGGYYTTAIRDEPEEPRRNHDDSLSIGK